MKHNQYKNNAKQNTKKICSISDKSVLISTIINEDENDEVDQLMATHKTFHWTESYSNEFNFKTLSDRSS